MTAIASILGILLVPALGTMGGWACGTNLRWPFQHLIALVCGVLFAPAFWFGLMVFGLEGGGQDSDPLAFMSIMIGTTAFVSVVTVFALNWKYQRE